MNFSAAILTVSDRVSRGQRTDVSGPQVSEFLMQRGFAVNTHTVVPDEKAHIEAALLGLSQKAALVVTVGGTGIAERDVTPEATRAVCDRLIDGISERMRAEGGLHTPLAILSRGLCGVCGRALVLNLPGSPAGAIQSLGAVIDVLPHALKLLSGDTDHEVSGHSAG